MKRWIHSATETTMYQNKRNSNKFLEVHRDGYGHQSARQFLEWDNGVKNMTGDGNLHRWSKNNMDELLDDYKEVESFQDDAFASCHVNASEYAWPDDTAVLDEEDWYKPRYDGPWVNYLSPIEESVLSDLNVWQEDDGDVVCWYDNNTRDEVGECDFSDYVNYKRVSALSSSSASEYADKFREYVEDAINSGIEGCSAIQASDGLRFKSYYTGYGYPEPEEILEEAREAGYRFYFWATDDDPYYHGMYNGDTIFVYNDIEDLEGGYREDAERFGRRIPDSVKEEN